MRSAQAPVRLFIASTGNPSLEINPVLTWPPEREEPAPARRSLLGLRLGAAYPERAGWTASARVGIFHERRLAGRNWLALGLDLGEEEHEVVPAGLLLMRAHVGVAGHLRAERDTPFRPLYMLGLAYESVQVRSVDTSLDRYALIGSLALEAGPPSGRWDARIEYLLFYGKSDAVSEAFIGLSLHF